MGTGRRSLDRKCTYNIDRKLVIREVLDVLVLTIDDLGQLLAVDHLLEDPHVDVVLEVIELGGVYAHNLGDG